MDSLPNKKKGYAGTRYAGELVLDCWLRLRFSRVVRAIYSVGHELLGITLPILSIWGYPFEAGSVFAGFLVYQIIEYKQIKDTCYQDLRAFLFCYGAGWIIGIVSKFVFRA